MEYIIILISIFFPIFIINKQERIKFNGIYVLECLCLILLVGLRFHIGGDSIRYEESFNEIPPISTLFENDKWWLEYGYQPLWIILISTCKCVSPNFVIFQLLHSTFINGTIFYYAKKYSSFRFSFILLYFISNYLYFSCEILRESISVAIFIISYKYLVNKKYLKYYFFCIISFLFHVSAIILFILPFIYKYRPIINGFKSYFTIILLGLGVSVIFKYSLLFIIDHFLSMPVLVYKAQSVIDAGKLNIFGIIIKLIFLAPAIITGVYIGKKSDNGTKLQCQFSLACYVLFLSVSLVFQPLSRLSNYFVIFYLYTFTDFIMMTQRKQIWQFGKLISCIIFIYQSFDYYNSFTIMESVENTKYKKYQLYYPYNSILNPQENPEREFMVSNEFAH